jgi:O-antigen/teichoic acid export membrane protein
LKINYIFKDKFNKIELSSGFKKYFLNTSWLFFERIVGMAVTFFVGVYVVRFLGPANFGLLSYAGSFVGLFSVIVALGLDNIVVRDLVKDERKRDELLGTTFTLRIISSILVLGIIAIAIRFTNNDNFTNLLIYIIAIGTIFQSFNVINFYFQSKVLSKYIVYAQIFSTILCSAIKVLLIYFNMALIYFAMVILIQSIILSLGFVVMYIKQRLSLFNWRIKYDLAKKLLGDSWPLILSGIAISVYMKIDQVMLKNMLDAKAVGNYAVAVRLSEIWYFIPILITNSLFPAIINAKKISRKLYYNRLQRLYDLMTFMSLSIAVVITFFAKDIIYLLFGSEYIKAGNILEIHVWVGVLVFWGVARKKWIIAENIQKKEFIIHIAGAILNVLLNLILIPRSGGVGAAWATVFSYFFASYFISFFIKDFRKSFYMYNRSFLNIFTLNFLKTEKQ